MGKFYPLLVISLKVFKGVCFCLDKFIFFGFLHVIVMKVSFFFLVRQSFGKRGSELCF